MANKNNPPKYDKEALTKELVPILRQALGGKESSNRYDPPGNRKAMGKYQFIESLHLNHIKSWAKKNGYGEIKNADDFRKNPELQEAYFEKYWVPNRIVPKTIELYDLYHSKTKLSLDEIANMVHFRGDGGNVKSKNPSAHYILANNLLEEKFESDNPPVIEDIKRYRQWRGATPALKPPRNLTDLQKKEIYQQYIADRDKIMKSDGSDYLKSLQIEKLNETAWQNDNMDIINEGLTEVNKLYQQTLDNKKNNVLKLVELATSINDGDGSINPLNSNVSWPEPNKDGGLPNKKFPIKNKFLKDNFNELIESYPHLFERGNDVNGKPFYVGVNQTQLLSTLQKEANQLLGPDQKLNIVEIKNGKIHAGKDYSLDRHSLWNAVGGNRNFLNIPTEFQNNLDTTILANEMMIPKIEVKPNWQTEAEEEKIEQQQESGEETAYDTSDPFEPTEAEKEIAEQEQQDNVTGHDNADLFFGANSYIDDESRIANTDDYKGIDIPAAEIGASLFGIISGMNAAGTELPERDEMISDALLQYTNELKRISQQGLSPEEEAYAKNNLKESYSIGLDTIVRASGGNRNVVLGNASRLDAQMQRGLMDLSLADFEKREKALFAYGEAVKYIDGVELNKQIANNERLYQNAVATKEAGAELMANGIQSLLDNVQYYKENAPGSANHALKSLYNRQAFGYDPNIKDNGKGDIKYSYSWYQKQKENFDQLMKTKQEYNDKYSSLSLDQKKEVDAYLKNTNYNQKLAYQFVDGLLADNQFNQAMNGQDQPYIPDMSDVNSGSNASTPENQGIHLTNLPNSENYDPSLDYAGNPFTLEEVQSWGQSDDNQSAQIPFNNPYGYGNRSVQGNYHKSNPTSNVFNIPGLNSGQSYEQAIQNQEVDNLIKDFNMNNLNNLHLGGYSQEDLDNLILESQSNKNWRYLEEQERKIREREQGLN